MNLQTFRLSQENISLLCGLMHSLRFYEYAYYWNTVSCWRTVSYLRLVVGGQLVTCVL